MASRHDHQHKLLLGAVAITARPKLSALLHQASAWFRQAYRENDMTCTRSAAVSMRFRSTTSPSTSLGHLRPTPYTVIEVDWEQILIAPLFMYTARLAERASGTSMRPMHPHSSTYASDTFKPRLPVDPFSAWNISIDSLLSSPSRSDVLLVLGEPVYRDLQPLLRSPYLVESLIIIASHNPPPIPSSPHYSQPTVCILHLDKALAVEDTGAVRLVRILEWASTVSHSWRSGADKFSPVTTFPEESAYDDQRPRRSSRLLRDSSLMPASSPSPSRSDKDSIRSYSTMKRHSSGSFDPTKRPFDALLNFVSPQTSDKTRLKQAILITTVSRPFLLSAPAHVIGAYTTSPSRAEKSRRRVGTLSVFGTAQRTSFPSSPASGAPPLVHSEAPVRPSPARIIHLLPTPCTEHHSLSSALQSFLLTFTSPPSISLSISKKPEKKEIVALVAPIGALSSRITLPSSAMVMPHMVGATITDLIFSGCLDEQMTSRSWIGSANDVKITSTSLDGIYNVPPMTPPKELPRAHIHDTRELPPARIPVASVQSPPPPRPPRPPRRGSTTASSSLQYDSYLGRNATTRGGNASLDGASAGSSFSSATTSSLATPSESILDGNAQRYIVSMPSPPGSVEGGGSASYAPIGMVAPTAADAAKSAPVLMPSSRRRLSWRPWGKKVAAY